MKSCMMFAIVFCQKQAPDKEKTITERKTKQSPYPEKSGILNNTGFSSHKNWGVIQGLWENVNKENNMIWPRTALFFTLEFHALGNNLVSSKVGELVAHVGHIRILAFQGL